MDEGQMVVPEVPEKDMDKSKKESEKAEIDLIESKNIRVINGLYALETEDEQPPTKNLKFIHESGKLSNERFSTTEDNTYWYRKQLRKVGIIMVISSFGLLLIILSSTTKYAQGAWDLMIFIFSYIISFIIGLLPEGWFSWWPF